MYLNRADGFVLCVFFLKKKESEIAIFRRNMGYRGVEEQESMLEKLIQRFLEESGWTQTCHHGGDKELGLRWGLLVKGNEAC